MTTEERITRHRKMAEGYINAYKRQGVQDGEKYKEWKFAKNAIYHSPYFTGDERTLGEFASTDGASATWEAKAYALKFSDWKPVDSRIWASANGFVMKNRWEGKTGAGITMGYYSYSFVETNEQAEIIRWETHVNGEYDDFLDVAIGCHGPFRDGEYLAALARVLKQAGIPV